ncbi:hypothetical protein EKO29_11610 [Colwellia sp. Arc7-635]|uniref:WapI family immunity protein n=1 Tax=Colwellia sp. Arc7-635 TaxID=2497879 RepID=UPI000F8513B5|nr:hypothetical protein [Colwellia sp. Arc7-635]AZQ84603.1 hypothetical protein EKO29_11610 [Colwellia sp. Arc7-635]
MKLKSLNPEVVKLLTNEDDKIFQLTNFELFEKGSFKCDICISSGGFGYKGTLFFDNGVEFIEKLTSMDEKLSGHAELKEDYYDHGIKFSMTDCGHVIVSGSIEKHSDYSQCLNFEFKTDQTCLEPFISDLKRVLVL